MTKVTFYEPAIRKLLKSPDGAVGRYLRRKGKLIQAAAKRQVGVRTGALRSSIHMRHGRDVRGQYVMVGSKLPYAKMHHEGTQPHMIFPTRASILKFTKRGQVIYAHAVAHPGTKANKYLTDNLRLIK